VALYRGSVRFIEQCAAPGAPILALPDIPILYFLSDHPSPTRYDLTIPGHVDGPGIAAALDATGTRCVVYNPQMYPEFPPFTTLFPELARHIEREFGPARFIEYGDTRWIGMVRRRP
jgi:hypothetical protein